MASATVPLLDDTIPFGEAGELHPNETMQKLSHPYTTVFHILFRGIALITYLFSGWFSDSFITSFVFVVLLLSVDFWLVKNITGRRLVGLRWWNYVDDDGISHWIFESKKSENYTYDVNHHEARIFWSALVICPVIWVLFFFAALFSFKFKWLVVVLIALALNGANLYGYIKCNFGTSTNLTLTTTDFVKSRMLKNAVNIISAQKYSNKDALSTKPAEIA